MVAPENRRDGRPERIIEPRYDWLMSDADFKDYHANANHIERQRGIKPAEMPDEHCPALAAEAIQRQAEQLLIKTAWPLIAPEGSTAEPPLIYGDQRKRLIDLLCRLVVNQPGYKNPLTGAAA